MSHAVKSKFGPRPQIKDEGKGLVHWRSTHGAGHIPGIFPCIRFAAFFFSFNLSKTKLQKTYSQIELSKDFLSSALAYQQGNLTHW